jgi:hypothetical protein
MKMGVRACPIIIHSDIIQAIYVQGGDKYKPKLQEQRRKHEDIKCVSWWVDLSAPSSLSEKSSRHLMQFALTTENIALSLLWPQVCMVDSLLARHSNALNSNLTTPWARGIQHEQLRPSSEQRRSIERFGTPCGWCGIRGHHGDRYFSKYPANLTKFPPRNEWNTHDGKPSKSLLDRQLHPIPRIVPSVIAHQVSTSIFLQFDEFS